MLAMRAGVSMQAGSRMLVRERENRSRGTGAIANAIRRLPV